MTLQSRTARIFLPLVFLALCAAPGLADGPVIFKGSLGERRH
jgi:hypothetical protein